MSLPERPCLAVDTVPTQSSALSDRTCIGPTSSTSTTFDVGSPDQTVDVGPDPTLWRHRAGSFVTNAWNCTCVCWKLQQKYQQPPNESYVSDKEYLFFWSTKIHLSVASARLSILQSRYVQEEPSAQPYMHVMSMEEALSLCLVQDTHHDTAQRSQIDFVQHGLRHFLQLHLSRVGRDLGFQIHVLTSAQCRADYIISVLSVLISSKCKVSTSVQVSVDQHHVPLLPVRLAAIQGEADKISMVFEHLSPDWGKHRPSRVQNFVFNVSDTSSFRKDGIYFEREAEPVLKLSADIAGWKY